jgi:hypothetical protein
VTKRVDKWSEEEQRRYIIDLILRRDLVEEIDNLVRCPKAFTVNRFLRKCFADAKHKTYSKAEWVKNIKVIDSYIKDNIYLEWHDGDFITYDKV